MKKVETKEKRSLSVKTVGWTLGGFGVAILAMLIISLYMLSFQFKNVKKTTEDYADLKLSALEVQTASDYLTDRARSFVVTGEDQYIFDYMEEGFTTNRREKALEALKNQIGETEGYKSLEAAVKQSKNLMDLEYYAMRLTINAFDIDYTPTNARFNGHDDYIKHCNEIQTNVMTVELKAEDTALSVDEQKHTAINFVYGESYKQQKNIISTKIVESIAAIDSLLEKNVLESSDKLNRVLLVQQIFIFILLIFFASAVIFIRQGLISPINSAIKKIARREKLDDGRGLREYQYLVRAYNEAREISNHNAEKLTYVAEHDHLTGVFNRAGYDAIYRDLNLDKTAYILIDVDNFKSVNDTYGHSIGDRMLKKVSNIITKHFPYDFVCRLGGDEFAILIFDYDAKIKDVLIKKFNDVEEEIMSDKDGLPAESISIGVAFGTKEDDTDSLYRKADKAMYEVKSKTKRGYCFYDSIEDR